MIVRDPKIAGGIAESHQAAVLGALFPGKLHLLQ